MNETLVWCALIFALAYVAKGMLPTYYDMNSARRHSLDNMRDDIYGLEESVEILITRVDAINDAVDANEQELMGAIKRFKDLDETVPGNEARHD